MIRFLLNFIYPLHCSGCGKLLPLNAKNPICGDCVYEVKKYGAGIENHDGFLLIHSTRYEGIPKNLIVNFKFHSAKELAFPLALFMKEAFEKYVSAEDVSLICAVPLHKKRKKSRGFNQSEMLAKNLSKMLKIPFKKNLIKRTIDTPSQREFSASGRKENVKNAFRAKKTSGKILLIDDVATTGATLAECVKTLKKSGAKEVISLVFARVSGLES